MRRLRTTGGEMAFVDAGEGPAVVLLHGFPTSSLLWRAFVPALAARMRVVAPDLLGYGASDRPARADLSVVAQAGYVSELLDGLGIDRAAFVGHDLGGGIAQLLALQGRAAAMVLIDSVAFDAWPIEGVRMLQSVEAAQETDELVRDTVALTLQLGMGRSERLTPELAEAYSSPFTGVGGPQAFFRAVRAIDGRGLAGREEDLAALDAPTLILWGEEDPFLGVELAERLSECLPASSLALLPGCSHFLPEDAPETIVPLVYEYLRARYLALPHGSHPHGPTPITLGRHAPA